MVRLKEDSKKKIVAETTYTFPPVGLTQCGMQGPCFGVLAFYAHTNPSVYVDVEIRFGCEDAAVLLVLGLRLQLLVFTLLQMLVGVVMQHKFMATML